ncbi:hypothetical protein LTR22_011852 [Elasticomyces elasticus]|nr:hypothetical protein LTR22_011852 [Elasticomyces elasticus]KAK4912441.1 hypothetical protein LTR49_019158 [Elasticomyces elasticus]KAK5751682.1 hypothetical protein LTS12_018294 [Elasticomyces elasticus]
MGKEKTKTGIPNKHIHARISYLQQAATYLTVQRERLNDAGLIADRTSIVAKNEAQQLLQSLDDEHPTTDPNEVTSIDKATKKNEEWKHEAVIDLPRSGGLPLYLASHLGQIARKTQTRLHPKIKHSICRTCNAVLVIGETCTKRVENDSRGDRKPHADVLVVQCTVCGAAKRFPVGAKRPKRKAARLQDQEQDKSLDSLVEDSGARVSHAAQIFPDTRTADEIRNDT